MNLSPIKAVAFAAALTLAPAASFATSMGGGPLSPAPSASFSNTVYGDFIDTWVFDLGTPSIVAASLTNVEITFQSMSIGGIKDFSAWLNGTQIFGPTSTVTSNGVTVKTQVLAGSSSLPVGTNFELKVTGSAVTGGSASYGGNLVVTPVPEPESYAMMLAGLAAIGFMARRRRRD